MLQRICRSIVVALTVVCFLFTSVIYAAPISYGKAAVQDKLRLPLLSSLRQALAPEKPQSYNVISSVSHVLVPSSDKKTFEDMPEGLLEAISAIPQKAMLQLLDSGLIGREDKDAIDKLTTKIYREELEKVARKFNIRIVVRGTEGKKDLGKKDMDKLKEISILDNESFGEEGNPIWYITVDPTDGTGNAAKYREGKTEGRTSSILAIGKEVIPVPDTLRAFALVYNDPEKKISFDLSKVAKNKEEMKNKPSLEEALRDFVRDYAAKMNMPLGDITVHIMGNGTFDKPEGKRKPHRHQAFYDLVKALGIKTEIFGSGTATPMVVSAVSKGHIYVNIAGSTETFMAGQGVSHLPGARIYMQLVSENGFNNVKQGGIDNNTGLPYFEIDGKPRTRIDMNNRFMLTTDDIAALRAKKLPDGSTPYYSEEDIAKIMSGKYIWSNDGKEGHIPISPLLYCQTLGLSSRYEFRTVDGKVVVDEGIVKIGDVRSQVQTIVIANGGATIREDTVERGLASNHGFRDLGNLRGAEWWNAMEPARRQLLTRFLGTQGTEPLTTIPFDHHRPESHYGHPELSVGYPAIKTDPTECMLLIAKNMASYVKAYLIHPGYLLGRMDKIGNFVNLKKLSTIDRDEVKKNYGNIMLHPGLPKDKLYVLKWEGEGTPNGEVGNEIGKRPTNQGEELKITPGELAHISEIVGLKFMTYVDSSKPEAFAEITKEVQSQSVATHRAGFLFFPENLPAKNVNGDDFTVAFESQDVRGKRKLTSEGEKEKAGWDANNSVLFAQALDKAGIDYDALKSSCPGEPANMPIDEIKKNLAAINKAIAGRFFMMLSGGDANTLVEKAEMVRDGIGGFVGFFAGRGVWQKSFTGVPSDPSNIEEVKLQIAENLKQGDARSQYNALSQVKPAKPWWWNLGLTRKEILAEPEILAVWQQLAESGHTISNDFITPVIVARELRARIRAGLVQDATTNPSSNEGVFAMMTKEGGAWVSLIEKMSEENKTDQEIYDTLFIEHLVVPAMRIFYEEGVCKSTNYMHGYVSYEFRPRFTKDPDITAESKSVEFEEQVRTALNELIRLDKLITDKSGGLHNFFLKVPATHVGIEAGKRAIALGININFTLIATEEQYADCVKAYKDGVREYIENGQKRGKINESPYAKSVASDFVSRTDRSIDELLSNIPKLITHLQDRLKANDFTDEDEKAGINDLIAEYKGLKEERLQAKLNEMGQLKMQAGLAYAIGRVYARFLKEFKEGGNWREFAQTNNVPDQLIYWGSTGVKVNNEYTAKATYAGPLRLRGTVNTAPDEVVKAMMTDGPPFDGNVETPDFEKHNKVLSELKKLGISIGLIQSNVYKSGLVSFAGDDTKTFKKIGDTISNLRSRQQAEAL